MAKKNPTSIKNKKITKKVKKTSSKKPVSKAKVILSKSGPKIIAKKTIDSIKSIKSNVKKEVQKKIPKGKVEITIKQTMYRKVPVEKHFILADGKRIESLLQLLDSFESMSEGVFYHHVNNAKNDFATWIEGAFNDKSLADKMRSVKNKAEAELKLLKHSLKKI